MLNFLTNWKKKKEILQKTTLLRLKNEQKKLKIVENRLKSQKNMTKTEKLIKEIAEREDLIDVLKDTHGKGDIEKILSIPVVQDLIKAFAVKNFPQKKLQNFGDTIKPSDREKQIHNFLKKNPDLAEKALSYIEAKK